MSTLMSALVTVPCLVAGVFLGVLVCVKLSTFGERRHDKVEHVEYGKVLTISWVGVSAPNDAAGQLPRTHEDPMP